MAKSLTKIIVHWTAGGYKPNAVEKQHYHYLVGKDGEIYTGTHKPEDNLNCNDGNYAAHCGGGNTGAIGVALCGMFGFKSIKNPGYCFITKKQCESAFKLLAELSRIYNIPIDNIMTHAEFGHLNPKTSSRGKIDITSLPVCYDTDVTRLCLKHGLYKGYGEFIRGKVKWYADKIKSEYTKNN